MLRHLRCANSRACRINLATLAPFIIYQFAVADTPQQAAALLAIGYLLGQPLDLTLPWVAALANALPPELGGGIDPNNPEQSGAIFASFVRGFTAYSEFLQDIFAPALEQQQAQMVAKEVGVNAVPAEDTWPPSAELIGQLFEGYGNEIESLANSVGAHLNNVTGYLGAGRPVDAVRYMAALAILAPLEVAKFPVAAGAVFAPPPFGGLTNQEHPTGGLITTAYFRTAEVAEQFVAKIAPDPLESVGKRQAIESSDPGVPIKDPNNVVNLTVSDPTQKVQDDNVKANGATILPGGNLFQPGKYRATTGSENRPLRALGETVRSTVHEVRDAVKDTVNAVTNLGKKKSDDSDSKQGSETNP